VIGQIPKFQWKLQTKRDRRKRIRLGLNSKMIRTPRANFPLIQVRDRSGPMSSRMLYGLDGVNLPKGLN
jgi:hypothetical protein